MPGNRAPDLYLTLAANLESWSLPFYGRTNVAVLAHLSNNPVLPVSNSIEAPEGVAATCMLTCSMQLTYCDQPPPLDSLSQVPKRGREG